MKTVFFVCFQREILGKLKIFYWDNHTLQLVTFKDFRLNSYFPIWVKFLKSLTILLHFWRKICTCSRKCLISLSSWIEFTSLTFRRYTLFYIILQGQVSSVFCWQTSPQSVHVLSCGKKYVSHIEPKLYSDKSFVHQCWEPVLQKSLTFWPSPASNISGIFDW